MTTIFQNYYYVFEYSALVLSEAIVHRSKLIIVVLSLRTKCALLNIFRGTTFSYEKALFAVVAQLFIYFQWRKRC